MTASRWTDQDTARLITLRDEGKTAPEIALLMGRTRLSVEAKTKRLVCAQVIPARKRGGPRNAPIGYVISEETRKRISASAVAAAARRIGLDVSRMSDYRWLRRSNGYPRDEAIAMVKRGFVAIQKVPAVVGPYTKWTDEETALFIAMREAGKFAREIEEALGRSKIAVENKARRLVRAGLIAAKPQGGAHPGRAFPTGEAAEAKRERISASMRSFAAQRIGIDVAELDDYGVLRNKGGYSQIEAVSILRGRAA